MIDDKWKRIMVKDEQIEVVDGLPITVYGLKFKELGQMDKYKNDNTKAMNYILELTLKKAPEVSDEQIPEILEDISLEAATKIIRKVMELSGIDTKDIKKLEAIDNK